MTDHEHTDEPDDGGEIAEPSDLKAVLDDADEGSVNDGSDGAPARMTWSSVTDTGGVSTPTEPDNGGFTFDLGGALARMAGDTAEADTNADTVDEPVEDPPADASDVAPVDAAAVAAAAAVADSATEPADVATPAAEMPEPVTEPVVEPEPEAAPVVSDVPPEPAVEPAPTPDVQDDPLPVRGAVAEEAPAAPVAEEQPPPPDEQYPRRTPGTHLPPEMRTEPEAPAAPAPSVPEPLRSEPAPSVFEDVQPDGAPQAGAAGLIPSLPASNPAAPPPVVEPVSTAPGAPDITALRSAQLKQTREQRKGKLFGRTVLAFVVLGGLIAAALIFGRSLLFDTSWDAQLTPIVNEVEAARGAEFEQTVPLDVISPEAFGERLRDATIGDDWVDQVPQWRALGLASGPVTAESVGAGLTATTVALYDADTDTIYLMDGADEAQASADLRVALEAAFDDQTGGPEPTPITPAEQPVFTGVSTLDSISNRAVDHLLASGGVATERVAADETLPMPIAYELAAVDGLGEAILAAAGVTPDELSPGDEYPPAVDVALDDNPVSTASGLLLPGEASLAPPSALGTDDWSLVWGARLSESTVDRLVGQVVADSFRPISRDGVECFRAVFQTANAASGSAVLAAMGSWAAMSPPAAQAVATSLSDTRIQLEACDPGAEASGVVNQGVVDALITRQIARLTN